MDVRIPDELLSGYLDDELGPKDRARVEAALAEDPSVAARLADLAAVSGAVRGALEQAAEEVDFTGFADRVVERLPPFRPPWRERLRVAVSEWFAYRRPAVVAGAVAAMLLVVVGVGTPVMLGGGEATEPLAGYAGPLATVVSVETPEGREPMLLTTASGTTLIYVR
jgi:anti-sigma factor RsiW